jgi:hypothetical protein
VKVGKGIIGEGGLFQRSNVVFWWTVELHEEWIELGHFLGPCKFFSQMANFSLGIER